MSPRPSRSPTREAGAAVLAGILSASFPLESRGQERERCWTIDQARSQLVVHVQASGLFAPALDDHRFVPQDWNGRACFDPGRPQRVDVELTVAADSLEDRQPALSAEDRATVERQVQGPDILNAAKYPEIRFLADTLSAAASASGHVEGSLNGHLTLHGETHPLDIPMTARWTGDSLRAAGEVTFRQSRFGIEPYSRFLGTVAIEDEVRVEFAIEATPQ